MTISKEYEHLNNGDLGRLLANHRLVPVGQRERRFENMSLPFGDNLIKLIGERLTSNGTVTEDRPEPDRMTRDAAIALLKGVSTFDELLRAFTDLVVEKAPKANAQGDLVAEMGEMKSRVLSSVEDDSDFAEGPTQLTDDEKVAQYNAVNNLDSLQAELSAGQTDPVKDSVDKMVGRVQEAVLKGANDTSLSTNRDADGNVVKAPVAKPEEPAPVDGASPTAKAAPGSSNNA